MAKKQRVVPLIGEIDLAIDLGLLKVRKIGQTDIFTPLQTKILPVRRTGKTKVLLVRTRVYIPNRQQGLYSCYPDLSSAIRSREHIKEKYGYEDKIGEIPQLEGIIQTLSGILARLDISLTLESDEKEEINKQLTEAAIELEKVRNDYKRKAVHKMASGLLDSLNRVNPLIAQNRIREARNLLESRFNEIGLIVPNNERHLATLKFERRTFQKILKAIREQLQPTITRAASPNVDAKLVRLLAEVEKIDLKPFTYRTHWIRVFIKKAIVAIRTKNFPLAQKNLQRAMGYLSRL